MGHPVRVNENGITATLKEFFVFFFIVIIFYRYFPRSVRIFNFLPLKMKAPDRKIGSKTRNKGSGTLYCGFGPFIAEIKT